MAEMKVCCHAEATQEEIEDIKPATEEALKRAEMTEATERAVERELQRWREKEQKKAAEAAADVRVINAQLLY